MTRPMKMNDEFTQQYQAAMEGAALFDLSHYGKIELTGPDARIFLHNLCTQDVKNLPVGAGCEAFLTTNKARVIAHIWIGHYPTESGSVIGVDMAAGQERVLQHLQHYLISEQVELIDRTQDLALLRLVGPLAADRLAGMVGQSVATLPVLHHVSIPGMGYIRRQSLLGLDGFDVICPTTLGASLRQRLINAGAIPAGNEIYQVLRIEAGLPEFGSDIDENRFAVETGRTAQAISYTKGCYLGQETIVMARDRGQINRLLMGVMASTEGDVLPPGTKLYRASEEVGQVTSCQHSPRLGHVIALAYLRRGNWEPGTELITDTATGGRSVAVCSLPFVSGPKSTLV